MMAKTITETASELGKDVKESVHQFGRSAGKGFDAARDSTGDALHAAASSVRKGSAALDRAAAGASDRLDATASYVEEYELRDTVAGLRKLGRKHLTGSLITAVALGFFAGAAFSRAVRPSRRLPETA